MRRLPVVMDDSTKAVFCHIGLTLFAAQEFEECLLGMLTGLYVTENPNNWQENYQKETENLNSMPLGKLLKRAQKIVSFDQEVATTLELAQTQRNKFIHGYYYKTCELLSDYRCHQKIIEELKELLNLFKKAISMIEPLSYQLMLEAGMTEQQIKK
jgi:hypothetical protein